MDAVKFIQERNRMCAAYTPKRCEGCPADNYGGEGTACIMIDKIDVERLVPIVEEWAAAHPRKTRQSVFLEQWPDAYVKYGMPTIRPCDLYAKYRKANGDCARHGINCAQCCREFWGQEVE